MFDPEPLDTAPLFSRLPKIFIASMFATGSPPVLYLGGFLSMDQKRPQTTSIGLNGAFGKGRLRLVRNGSPPLLLGVPTKPLEKAGFAALSCWSAA
jgi:hypothetical protein